MAGLTGITASALLTASLTASAPAGLDGAHALVLIVVDMAQLGEDELAAAREVAMTILQTAEIQPIWIHRGDPAPPSAMQITVLLAPTERGEQMLARLRRPRSVLGMAPAQTFRVYVFCDRVRQFARSAQRSFTDVLGMVIAHEVGHHLLPGQGHVLTGVMQGDLAAAASTPWLGADQGAAGERRVGAIGGPA